MEIQLLKTGISFCREHLRMPKTSQILKPLPSNCHLVLNKLRQITLQGLSNLKNSLYRSVHITPTLKQSTLVQKTWVA